MNLDIDDHRGRVEAADANVPRGARIASTRRAQQSGRMLNRDSKLKGMLGADLMRGGSAALERSANSSAANRAKLANKRQKVAHMM